MKSLKLIAASAVLLSITGAYGAEQHAPSHAQQIQEYRAAQTQRHATTRPAISIEQDANKDNPLVACGALQEIAKFLSLENILSAQCACHKLRRAFWDPERMVALRFRENREIPTEELGKRINAKYQQFVKYTQARNAHNPVELNLNFCNLTDLPDNIELPNNRLQFLSLAGNKKIQPAALEEFFRCYPHIQGLDLGFCALTDIPDSIGMLKDRLRSLILLFNRRIQPASLGKLFRLCRYIQVLILAFCNLTDLPDSIGLLTDLQSLDLHGNKNIQPAALEKLFVLCPRIQELDLSSCNLTDLPDSIGELKNLRVVNLRHNLLDDAEKERMRALLPNTNIRF